MENSKTMAEIVNQSESKCKNFFHAELKKFPVTFVNAIRRILLTDLPTVVIRNVEVLENTTQLPHEMLRHRMEMLPVNVKPTDASTIREAKVELRVLPEKEGTRSIRTNDFVIESSRPTLLMNDRELDTPLLFVRVRPNESVHIRGKLAVETKTASQVCTATTMWHVDPVRAKDDKRIFVDENNGSPAVFDNFYAQRSYSRNAKGRPDWIDLDVESVGVIPAKELVDMSVKILRKQVEEYMAVAIDNIQRQKDDEYRVEIDQGGHTVCALLQEVMYETQDVQFVSYDIPHPLRPETVLRFHTKRVPETILKAAQTVVEEYCESVEKSL
jgi:DNA-directed RNA polymerase subunit L